MWCTVLVAIFDCLGASAYSSSRRGSFVWHVESNYEISSEWRDLVQYSTIPLARKYVPWPLKPIMFICRWVTACMYKYYLLSSFCVLLIVSCPQGCQRELCWDGRNTSRVTLHVSSQYSRYNFMASTDTPNNTSCIFRSQLLLVIAQHECNVPYYVTPVQHGMLHEGTCNI